MPQLQRQTRAAIARIDPQVLLAGQASVSAPVEAGAKRRSVQSISEGARGIALEIANVVAELGGNTRLAPGVDTSLAEAESLVLDRPVDTRTRNFQIADALARSFAGLAEKILEGELHVDLLPMEVPTYQFQRWNVIDPVQNLAADPYPSTFGDWVQTDSQGAGAQVTVQLPAITPESKGLMVGANSSGALGGAATFKVQVSGADTIAKVGSGQLQTTRGGALIFISDGVSNWIRYFAL